MSLTGMITRSGVEITRDTGVPPLVDIAVSLARTPRFAGMTGMPWTVLEHSLFVEELAERETGLDPVTHRSLRIAALLHDAHEAITGDISTHFKTFGMKVIQASLDVRIMDAYMPGGLHVYETLTPLVKALDQRALLAEAVLLHPAVTRGNVTHYFGDAPAAADLHALRTFLAEPEYHDWQFLERYRELVGS